MTLQVVDLSNNNGLKNLADYPADAYLFKATEGCNFIDRYCDPFVQQAIKAGKPFGVYHFIDDSNWQAQTDFFIQNVQGYIGKGILVLDYEMYGRQGTGVLKQMLDRIQQKTGIKALVYTSASVLFEEDFSAIVQADYGLWVAAYQSNFPKIKHWPNAVMWQYTSTPYDKNYFYGDINTWNAYATAGKGESNESANSSSQISTPNKHDNIIAKSPTKKIGNYIAKLEVFNEFNLGVFRGAGWLVPQNGAKFLKYGYVFFMDANNPKVELGRCKSKGIVRDDVNSEYRLPRGTAFGLDGTMDIKKFAGKKCFIKLRRTNDPKGDVIDGQIVDIDFTEYVLMIPKR
ncbi:GH25 family lysozyme [Enterococcus hirae]|uniref:GH25 family lysozyme n=1 Tax=Enterococcus hirae TaxID=1354 RepID=UPI000BA85449|nr:GH25 family lysozyme [Enterococcus hirae]ASV81999.1 glycosyl hydrolase family 25 [Enterococcus hirae]